jgi:hypothetical protein
MIREKVAMSERSLKLARLIRRARGCQPDPKHHNNNELLDKGFAFLKIDIEREFHNQISDVNREPGCNGTFGCSFTNKESRVFKVGEEGRELAIAFHPNERAVQITGKAPVKFHYFLQVRVAQDQSTWDYEGGENPAAVGPINGKLDAIVERALFALFGVES